MRRKVTVGLVDLKRLVGMCCDQQVHARAQVMILNELGRSDPAAAFEFASAVGEAEPEAQSRLRFRFRRLLGALESGEDIDASLASFVRDIDPRSLMRAD